MAQLNLSAAAPATVNTPASGSIAIGVTTAGQLYTKDNAGNIRYNRLVDQVYDVTNNPWANLVGDASTDNLANFNTLYAALPAWSTLYWPAGQYRFSGECTLNRDIRLRMVGDGAQRTLLQLTNATSNLFNFNVAGWFLTFEDMNFSATVTKTAGAFITVNAGNNVGIDVRRCGFSAYFYGIYFSGAQSGNLSVLDSLNFSSPAVNGRALKIDGSTINLVLSNSTANSGSNASAVAGSCNVEINQCGAVQIIGCDLIGAVNSLWLNASSGGSSSIAAVYCTNTFFDQSGGSTVKISGANTANRIKFVQCGIAAGLIGTYAVEINGTGSGSVGSATALPAGIQFDDCDIYYAPGSSTAAGIAVNGCQDVDIQATRFCGFGGAGGAAVNITPSSPAGTTTFRLIGNTFGPNSNLTVTNTTGVLINAGAAAVGNCVITDNTFVLGGNTTAITDNSTLAAGAVKTIANNPGAVSSRPTNVAATAIPLTTVTNVDSLGGLPIPANVRPGTRVRCEVRATNSATAQTLTATLRFGTANSNADAAVLTQAFTLGTALAGSGKFVFEFAVLTSTTADASIDFVNGNNAATGIAGNISLFAGLSTPATIATTALSYLGVYFSSATAAAITIRSVTWEVL